MTVALYIIRVAASATPRIPVFAGDATDFNRRTSGAIAALAGGSMFDPGFIILNAAQSAPAGWLVCDGSAIERVSFPALYAAIGDIYGAGDGSTTFNIPTQAQCVPPTVAPTPPQVITGGSVDPVTAPAPPTSTDTAGSGGNTVTGGRVRPPGYVEP